MTPSCLGAVGVMACAHTIAHEGLISGSRPVQVLPWAPAVVVFWLLHAACAPLLAASICSHAALQQPSCISDMDHHWHMVPAQQRDVEPALSMSASTHCLAWKHSSWQSLPTTSQPLLSSRCCMFALLVAPVCLLPLSWVLPAHMLVNKLSQLVIAQHAAGSSTCRWRALCQSSAGNFCVVFFQMWHSHWLYCVLLLFTCSCRLFSVFAGAYAVNTVSWKVLGHCETETLAAVYAARTASQPISIRSVALPTLQLSGSPTSTLIRIIGGSHNLS